MYSSVLDPAFLKYLYEFSFGDSITLHTGVAYYANACIPYVELEGEGEWGIVPLSKKRWENSLDSLLQM